MTAIVYIVLTAFLSRGDNYIVESDKPLEDIVVRCHWSTMLRNLHGGTHSVTQRKSLVVKSGEEFSCGLNWVAGLTLSFRSSSGLMHPTHTFAYVTTRDDGVDIRKPVSKIKQLDDQKAKYEAGFWNEEKNPFERYYKSLPSCGFPYKYFDYYDEVNGVDMGYFKEKYHDPIFECHKRRYPILKIYDPYTHSKIPSLSERMDRFWNAKEWNKFK